MGEIHGIYCHDTTPDQVCENFSTHDHTDNFVSKKNESSDIYADFNTSMLRPLSDRVFVREMKPPEKKGTIFIPEQAAAMPQIGEVVAVGPGMMRDNDTRNEMPVKVGDLVVYGRNAGVPIKVLEERLQCMHVTEIYAVLKKAKTKARCPICGEEENLVYEDKYLVRCLKCFPF